MGVKHEAALFFQSAAERGIVEWIFTARIAIGTGYICKYGAVRESYDGALLAHPLVKPHRPAQGLGGVRKVPCDNMRINRGSDAIDIDGGNLPYAEFLLVGYGGHHHSRDSDRDEKDQRSRYDGHPSN